MFKPFKTEEETNVEEMTLEDFVHQNEEEIMALKAAKEKKEVTKMKMKNVGKKLAIGAGVVGGILGAFALGKALGNKDENSYDDDDFNDIDENYDDDFEDDEAEINQDDGEIDEPAATDETSETEE